MTGADLVLMVVVQLVCAVIIGVPCYFLGYQRAEDKAWRDKQAEWERERAEL